MDDERRRRAHVAGDRSADAEKIEGLTVPQREKPEIPLDGAAPPREIAEEPRSRSVAENDRAFSDLDRNRVDADQTASDADQTASDADQTASDADQAASDADEAAAVSDQQLADLDQLAANRDQAAADHDQAMGVPNPFSQRAYASARTERADRSAARRVTAAARATADLDRKRHVMMRDETARLRDLTASSRDRAAEARDRLAGRQAKAILAAGKTDEQTIRALLAAQEEARRHAAADRVRAASDRHRAAADRADAAAERRQARIDFQRAQLDSLTGVYTRDLGNVAIQHEIDRARRSGDPFVLAFVDVDGLKRVNDRAGHAAGDALLLAVVDALQATLRSYDPVVRLGGDEFLCGLINTTFDVARRRVEHMKAAVAHGPLPGSISVGLASLGENDTLESLTANADRDMYADKHQQLRKA